MEKVFYPATIEPESLPGIDTSALNSSSSNKSVFFPGVIDPVQKTKTTNAKNIINSNIDTQSARILGGFTFGQLGAIRIGKYVNGSSGDISITSNGIVARNSAGANTITIDGTTGNLTIIGTLGAGSIISSSITVDWAQIANIVVENADIVSISATKITSGSIASARMETNVLSALQANISTLSAITGNMGTLTAGAITGGTITGVTITGGTFQTVSSGRRITITEALNSINFYPSSGGAVGSIFTGVNSIMTDQGLVISCTGLYIDNTIYTGGNKVQFYGSKQYIDSDSDDMRYFSDDNHEFYQDTNLKTIIDENIFTEGDLMANGSKPFLIPHPDGTNRLLKYTAQESPDISLRYRGFCHEKGLIKLPLPEHFVLVTEPDGLVTVNLTATESGQILYVESIVKNHTINVVSTGDFMYEVVAIRKGYLDSEVEIDLDLSESMTAYSKYTKEYRDGKSETISAEKAEKERLTKKKKADDLELIESLKGVSEKSDPVDT